MNYPHKIIQALSCNNELLQGFCGCYDVYLHAKNFEYVDDVHIDVVLKACYTLSILLVIVT